MPSIFARLSRKQTVSLIIVGLLFIALPVTIYLVKLNQDIRQRASVQGGAATISLVPADGTQFVADTASTVDVRVNTGVQQVDGVQIIATIESTVLNNGSFDVAFIPSPPQGLNTIINSLEWDAAVNAYRFNYVLLTPIGGTSSPIPYSTNGADVSLGHLTFTASVGSTATVQFDQTLTKISQNQTALDIVDIPTSATYTFVEPGTQKTLTARVSIAGITQNRGAIDADLKIVPIGSNNFIFTTPVSFTHVSGNIHQATITIPESIIIDPSTSYWIAIKGEKHAQRAFLDVALTDGATLDLTNRPLEPGDLPTQNGVIDNNDLNKVLEVFAKPQQTQADLDVADVNYDGVVNSIDMGLIFASLSSQDDEGV